MQYVYVLVYTYIYIYIHTYRLCSFGSAFKNGLVSTSENGIMWHNKVTTNVNDSIHGWIISSNSLGFLRVKPHNYHSRRLIAILLPKLL